MGIGEGESAADLVFSLQNNKALSHVPFSPRKRDTKRQERQTQREAERKRAGEKERRRKRETERKRHGEKIETT